ncbi:GntR family transcriptional regulator [Sulfitobacter mediterraneus]|uniref:GntR family transcriptional regulator n=1 Tax=Sulfitobacter mediterraneus TaxID=83219 RepID=A0A2T6CEH4_9RHOB|nr:GntR family transcriptional regulator [Sulfitobacter mediterraneus]KIN76227.1 putative, Transcriptional regulator [Sulfitobacter mediterraneus KCTC 32188]PTX73894.1 GntR family transcriptional regulator [Sulfitobacter mediterraneus]
MATDVISSNRENGGEQSVKTPAHQHVYEELRQMILFGDLAPGQAVTIQGLTKQLGAGMTPVREALRRLISEGALTHQGNRRVSVPELTESCANELYFMRKTLESELTRRAAERMTPDRLAALQSCDRDLNQAIALGDVGGYLTHNYRFHSLIYDGADAPIMSATVDRLWLRFGPSLRVICGRFGTSNLPDKHKDLLEALAANNIEAAVAAMAEDVEQGMLQVQAAFEEGQQAN